MKLTIFGATGALGGECLQQALDAGHSITVLVRSRAKLPQKVADKITVVEGNALAAADVAKVLSSETDAVLFAIGVDKQSPENLCTDVTRNILTTMRQLGIQRLIWCGGGSALVTEDQISFGARVVEKFGSWFMALRHNDKVHLYELLQQNRDIGWIGIRPLQMRNGKRRQQYRLGFYAFNGMSWISFADCADAMVHMLDDDTWLHKAPIIQY